MESSDKSDAHDRSREIPVAVGSRQTPACHVSFADHTCYPVQGAWSDERQVIFPKILLVSTPGWAAELLLLCQRFCLAVCLKRCPNMHTNTEAFTLYSGTRRWFGSCLRPRVVITLNLMYADQRVTRKYLAVFVSDATPGSCSPSRSSTLRRIGSWDLCRQSPSPSNEMDLARHGIRIGT